MSFFFASPHKKNKQLLHMRYHLFLKYGWCPQNLGKEAVRTAHDCSSIFYNIMHKIPTYCFVLICEKFFLFTE